MNNLKLMWVFIGVDLFLSGCTGIAIEEPLNTTQTFPVPINYCVTTSATENEITHLSTKDKTLFNNLTTTAIADINTIINRDLTKIDTIKLTGQAVCAVAKNTDTKDTAIPTSDGFQLTIDLSGYGSLKRKWKKYLIGSGVVEGVVQGVIVASATGNVLLGAGVFAEECTSEYLSWNGIDWFLGETYAPVTLEATLVRLSDQTVVWQDTEFVSSNDDELKKLTVEEQKQKEYQLLASLHKAEDDLFLNLRKYIEKKLVVPNTNKY